VEHDDFVPPPIPAAPSNLTAVPAYFSQVNLSWSDNSSNEFSFEIERCTGASCSNFSPLDAVIDNVTTYIDTDVVQGITYCYRVRAANTGGASGYTNTACTTLQIPVFIPLAVR
jgi:titin